MREGTNNILSGSLIIGVGILLLLEMTKVQYAGMEDGLGTGPAFFPRMLMIAFIVTGGLTVFSGIKQKGDLLPAVNWPKVTKIILLTTALFCSVPHLGFLFSAIPFLIVAMWVMGFRKKRMIALIVPVFSLTVWYLCCFVFEIVLPASPWFTYV